MWDNPKRTPQNQALHDKILKVLAEDMRSKGFSVKADHIYWPGGSPPVINGYVPDLIAESISKGNFIMEVEDCDSIADEHTNQQLKAFAKVRGYSCYIVVPSECYIETRVRLNNWGLLNVGIGLYDEKSGKITYVGKN